MSAGRLTVYHDGSCPLCRAEIAMYGRAWGADAVAFVDTSDKATELGADLQREVALARFHVRDADGRLVSGAAGFALLWRALPGWRWLGRFVGARPVSLVAEAAYRALLPLRPHLARLLLRSRLLRL